MGNRNSKPQTPHEAAALYQAQEGRSKSPAKDPPPYETIEEPWKVFWSRGFGVPGVVYHREIYQPDGSKWCRYGVAQDERQPQPNMSFTCTVQLRSKWSSTISLQMKCVNIGQKLLVHRREHGCSCDFEYNKTGRSSQKDKTRLCEVRSYWINRCMESHDKKCACEAFRFGVDDGSAEKLHRPSSAPWLYP